MSRVPEAAIYFPDPVYFDFQVQRPAQLAGAPPPSVRAFTIVSGQDRGAAPPPDALVLQFVVGSGGRADMRTFKVLNRNVARYEPLWTRLTRLLDTLSFRPAEHEGKAVPQLMQVVLRW